MQHPVHDAPSTIAVVGANAGTLVLNAHGKLPKGLIEDLDRVEELSQEADDDAPTSWHFAGEAL